MSTNAVAIRRVAATALRLGPAASEVAAVAAELAADPTEVRAALGSVEFDQQLDDLAGRALLGSPVDEAAYLAEFRRRFNAELAARAQREAERRQRESWADAAEDFADMLAARRGAA